MHFDIACTLSLNLDNMQTTRMQAPAHELAELLPGFYLLILTTVHLHCEAEIQPRRRTEKLFKMLWIGGLRQEGEDPPSVVVDQHDSEVKPV